MREFLRSRPFGFALLLSLALLVANIIAEPSFGKPGNWPQELASFAPLAIVAMASTPSILSGGGGLDLSVGTARDLLQRRPDPQVLPARARARAGRRCR